MFLNRKSIFAKNDYLERMAKLFVSIYSIIFAKRTILLVTKKKIVSITLGPFLQCCIILGAVWVINIFVYSMQYNEIISTKVQEINRLKSVNYYFEKEFSNVSEKLKKVNEYLASTADANNFVNGSNQIKDRPKDPRAKDLSKEDEHTLNQIKEIEDQLERIQFVARMRINKIESAIAITGLSVDNMPFKKKLQNEKLAKKAEQLAFAENVNRQGGPLSEVGALDSVVKTLSDINLEDQLKKLKFTNEFDYLMVLEKLARVMPFSKPMKNYYISSNFGSRIDPITRRVASHRGLDFVGANREEIISPSEGKVVLAGRFGDYGNAIVIDHGFGITTRYGHLRTIKVEVGQKVKRGDVIAIQGNTGRSTGSHLHYEVRYKNSPFNPRKFLEAGDHILSNSNDS
jgi:murein DD-endopeptidase MepM/ murein hydrolase activator NlpD